ncbi:hypothetical protein [Streptomyces durocortorensis]|uniref:Lipoprotein n=1 Tax=Streptomyces durocortorensis TaxID=2811104 RepID=A0ABS2HV98_9ACTN|nr:hypothetical protein [Streptomyces durocortorensis]MBM7053708.1 hypothetical protein [Streptomyces durocortorensis]
MNGSTVERTGPGGAVAAQGVRRRRRVVAGLALLAALTGCSVGGSGSEGSAPGPAPTSTRLKAGDLRPLLLEASDLGKGVRSLDPDPDKGSGESPVTGGGPKDCEALEPYGLDGPIDELIGTEDSSTRGFSRDGELLSQRLYSRMPASMSDRMNKAFAALTACPEYSELLVLGDRGTAESLVKTRAIEVKGVEGPTYGYERTVMDKELRSPSRTMTIAVTRGWTTVMLTGSPDLVKEALEPALRKATQ